MNTFSLKVAALSLAVLGLSVGGIAATSMGPTHGMSETIIAPHSLNLDSHGKFVTAIVKNATALPDDLKASDLTATASIAIGGSAVSVDATVRAYDGTNHTVVLKIDRQQISAAIAGGGSVDTPVKITVTVRGGGGSVARTGEVNFFSHP